MLAGVALLLGGLVLLGLFGWLFDGKPEGVVSSSLPQASLGIGTGRDGDLGPPAPAPDPPPPPRAQIDLKEVRAWVVYHDLGDGKRFPVMHVAAIYRFTKGQPEAETRYQFRVQFEPKSEIVLNAYGKELMSEGEVEQESGLFGVRQAATFEAFEQTSAGGPFQSISQKVKCQVDVFP
jgi:hypothetical protein